MTYYNSNRRQPWSYQVAINECKRIDAPYKFVRYANGGLMLCINSPSYGWFPYRGSDCYGQRAWHGKFFSSKFNFCNDLCGVDSIMKHGSPEDRGSADAYYQSPRDPHYWQGPPLGGIRVPASMLTQAQIDSYNQAYNNEEDRKDYGWWDLLNLAEALTCT